MAPVIEGYWGKQTSTLDWCEENYVVNYYVAEFWNTLSNCIMIFAPLLMMLVGHKEKHEKRFIYSFLALTVVGIGSWLFHMTLKYSMQLMDEVPMIWYMMDSKPNKENFMLSCVLVLYCVIVTLVYILINAPIFHQVSYGIMVFCIVILSTKTALTMKCNRKMHLLGIGFYALGFLLWNVDNIYCSHLRSIREHPVGKVSGMLFECHAWWHVFAGLGTYTGLLFGVHTRLIFLKQNPKIKYILCFWPYVSADTKSK